MKGWGYESFTKKQYGIKSQAHCSDNCNHFFDVLVYVAGNQSTQQRFLDFSDIMRRRVHRHQRIFNAS
jgi:hypothetical protein